MIQFLNEPEDCRWLRETHLKHLPGVHDFNSFTLDGNEDAPSQLTLYKSADPLYTDANVVVLLGDGTWSITHHPCKR